MTRKPPRAVDFQEIISKNPRGARSRATEAKYSSLLAGVEARKELLLRVGREPGARAVVAVAQLNSSKMDAGRGANYRIAM